MGSADRERASFSLSPATLALSSSCDRVRFFGSGNDVGESEIGSCRTLAVLLRGDLLGLGGSERLWSTVSLARLVSVGLGLELTDDWSDSKFLLRSLTGGSL